MKFAFIQNVLRSSLLQFWKILLTGMFPDKLYGGYRYQRTDVKKPMIGLCQLSNLHHVKSAESASLFRIKTPLIHGFHLLNGHMQPYRAAKIRNPKSEIRNRMINQHPFSIISIRPQSWKQDMISCALGY